MTAEQVQQYIKLANRKSFIICHSGNDWKPEYEEELQQINQEHAKRKELERCSLQQKQY